MYWISSHPHSCQVSHQSVLLLQDLDKTGTHSVVLLTDVGVQTLPKDKVYRL